MNDLLKEAIADAKAVREVALANAKLALEEAFTPRLQSMLSQKLSEEAEMDDDSKEVEEEGFFNEFAMGEAEDETGEEGEHEEKTEEGTKYDDMDEYFGEAEHSDEEMEKEGYSKSGFTHDESIVGEMEDEEIDEDLMEIIRQLEEDLASSEIGKGDNKKPSAKASDDSTQDPAGSQKVIQLVEEEDEKVDEAKEDDEDVNEILRSIREEEDEKVDEASELDINEILRALREEEEDEKVEEAADNAQEIEEINSKLREAYAVITFLRSKINEVNLLNSKLLFSNKIFKKHSLTEGQKLTVIENFDRASSLREVKLVFATLSEAFKSAKTSIKPLKESFASKPIASTRPKNIINEGDDMQNRLRKLAGLK
jgi:hypothetical protein